MGENCHPTVRLDYRGEETDIDEELAPLTSEMWKADIDTVSSCQDVGEALADLIRIRPYLDQGVRNRSTIDFATPDSLLNFFEALANAGPRDAFYVRMVHWTAPDAWQVTWRPSDFGVEETMDNPGPQPPSQFAFDDWVHLSFPRSDIPEMTRRMKIFNVGNLPSPGEIDWSTIEFDETELP